MAADKKLLILSCSTGSGHFRAAEALILKCKSDYPEIQVLHLDIANFLGWLPYISIITTYDFISTHIPFVYKLIYYATDTWLIQTIFRIFARLINFGGRKIIDQINEFKPDIIVSTHYLAQVILPNNFSAPIDTIITDYCAHKSWLPPKIRRVFVATEEIKDSLTKLGFKAFASGIPIHPEFFKEKKLDELKIKFGIRNNYPTILILPAPYEKISTNDIVNELLKKFLDRINIVVIVGNKKNLNSFTDKNNLIILKKTANIDEWMRIADVIVTKAGGLTITEVLQLQKPLIIINSIPGQEDYNSKYIEKNNFGMRAVSARDATKKIELILDNPNFLNKKSYPDASKIILEKVFLK